MDKDLLERDLAAARVEIDRIDGEVRELVRRRTMVEEYAASCARLLGALDGVSTGDVSAPTSQGQPMADRFDLPSGDRPSSDLPPAYLASGERHTGGRGALSSARRYWGGVVSEAIGIIEREGRPLTAAEIHALHSHRDRLTPVEVYDALYKRARRRRFVESVEGKFWLVDRPRP